MASPIAGADGSVSGLKFFTEGRGDILGKVAVGFVKGPRPGLGNVRYLAIAPETGGGRPGDDQKGNDNAEHHRHSNNDPFLAGKRF